MSGSEPKPTADSMSPMLSKIRPIWTGLRTDTSTGSGTGVKRTLESVLGRLLLSSRPTASFFRSVGD
jgi:hypothetical protein